MSDLSFFKYLQTEDGRKAYKDWLENGMTRKVMAYAEDAARLGQPRQDASAIEIAEMYGYARGRQESVMYMRGLDFVAGELDLPDPDYGADSIVKKWKEGEAN